MRELVVAYGKGGTGKTSLTAAFSNLAENHVVCDADVDAADLRFLLAAEARGRHDFMGGVKAIVDCEPCNRCGQCREFCRFNAIDDEFVVDAIACEGYGVCVDLCPVAGFEFRFKNAGNGLSRKTE